MCLLMRMLKLLVAAHACSRDNLLPLRFGRGAAHCTSMVRWLRSGCPVLGMHTSSTPLFTCRVPGGDVKTQDQTDLNIMSSHSIRDRQVQGSVAWRLLHDM